ncbi:MAG: rhomboid family intramembrane serine protease [Pseudomonadales bacterium]|nr:rhomboid family intramembrane serine protease [Pseudomonadales bacterium]
MIIAFETEPEEDLRPLVAWLRSRRIPHRIWEEGGRLRLAVPDARLVPVVEAGVSALRDGTLAVSEPRRPGGQALARLLLPIARAPATAALVLLALLFAPATMLPFPAVEAFTLRWLMIVPIERVGDFIDFSTLPAALAAGEFWRLWTPALLHFGAVHLAFNLLWLWEFGRRIEAASGHARLLEAVILLAPLANVAQYLMDDGPRFGGLSGVVYGLLGYIVVAARRSPHPALRLPAALVVMLVLFLVFFSTGATEPFGLRVANGAHWGGFLAGLLLALLRVPDAGPPSAPSEPRGTGGPGPA